MKALATSRRPVGGKGTGSREGRPPRRSSRDDERANATWEEPEEGAAAAPRPKSEAGQRERRMFAGLLGTLKKRKTSMEEKERDVLEKRKTIEAAVSGKSEEISRELRESQYKAFVEKRDAEEKTKFELDVKFKETERAFIEAQYKNMHAQMLEGAILTTTEPMIVYKPKKLRAGDEEACAASAKRLEDWRASNMERVENAIKVIHSRREGTLERRAKARMRNEEREEDVDIHDVVDDDDDVLEDFDEDAMEDAGAAA